MCNSENKTITILIATEFFYPDIGGIETHTLQLARNLIKIGFNVVVLTRHFGKRRGIRYCYGGIKVYNLLAKEHISPCGLPTIIEMFPYYRNILIREQVDIIHTHQSSSRFNYEIVLWGNLMGYKTVFTDHSLFSFSSLGPVFLNEIMKHFFTLKDHAICISNRHKENFILRSEADPRNVSVIGNALDSNDFKYDPTKRSNDHIVIVVISRMTERKGIGLLIDVVPIVCERHTDVKFIIGGSGPMISDVQEMINKHYLHDRVKLLGTVPNNEVAGVLQQGHIFLNTSQTESFCIAILEAASCGLLTVATNVGGVPEILPSDMILLADYDPQCIANRIDDAINMLPNIPIEGFHERVKEMYSWMKVAEKTSKVYYEILSRPRLTICERFSKLYSLSPYFGKILVFIIGLCFMEWAFFEWMYPRDEIEIAPKWAEIYRKEENINNDCVEFIQTNSRSAS